MQANTVYPFALTPSRWLPVHSCRQLQSKRLTMQSFPRSWYSHGP